MRVGDDVAVGVDDDSRSESPLPADHDVAVVAARIVERAVTGHDNLHDAGRGPLDQRLHRLTEASQRISILCRLTRGREVGAADCDRARDRGHPKQRRSVRPGAANIKEHQ
jgi:hypothetical protein